MMVLKREVKSIKAIVFDVFRTEIEPTIYRIKSIHSKQLYHRYPVPFFFVIHNRRYKNQKRQWRIDNSEAWATFDTSSSPLKKKQKTTTKKQQNTENQKDDQHGAHQTTGLTLGALEG